MKQNDKVKIMTISALLSALGILIPMTFPSLRAEPASYTLASHVPITIAMFISPTVATFVAIITSFGFLINGFHIVIVARAVTHIIFALVGALILKKNTQLLSSFKNTALFSFFISLIHGAAEVAVVSFFYFSGMYSGMFDVYREKGFLISVILLVGVGTVIHGMVDYSIATIIWQPLQKVITIPVSARVSLHKKTS